MIRLGICNELFEGWELPRVCETVKRLGYDGLELAPFTIAPRITDVSAGRRREIRAEIEGAGLSTIGLHWLLAKTEGLYLTSPDPAVRRRTADYLVALAEASRDLGGTLMVFGSPKQRDLMPGVSHDQARDFAVEVFGSIAPKLDALEVDLCVEPLAPNDTNFLNTIDQGNDLIRRVNHPRIVLHMDVKAQSFDPGGSVSELISRHASRARHFHAHISTRKTSTCEARAWGRWISARS
jgi:sugar phosphate isomerase/epimerase